MQQVVLTASEAILMMRCVGRYIGQQTGPLMDREYEGVVLVEDPTVAARLCYLLVATDGRA
jgi:hypothetical protein